jgi:DNA-binding transcriptional MerR regulator
MTDRSTPLRQGFGAQALSPRELAASAGISTDTLRHYERRGVLPPPPRTRAGYRRYPASAVARVALVRRALQIGFSLEDLARVTREREQGGAPCRKVRAIVADRLSRLDSELEALTALKAELTAILADWDRVLARTPPNTQARLLDSLTLASRDGCTKR